MTVVRAMAMASLLVFVSACGGGANSGGGGGGGGGGGNSSGNTASNGWIGDYAATHIEWNYDCDNGNRGSSFNENVTTLRIAAGKSKSFLNITQTDLFDPQTWECQLAGSTATVVAVLDTTNATSDFGSHSSEVVTDVTTTGEFERSSTGTITTTWHVDYEQSGTRCSEVITGTFEPSSGGSSTDGTDGNGFDEGADF